MLKNKNLFPASNLIYLQRIGKNESPKKLVISSIQVSDAKLYVSAFMRPFDTTKNTVIYGCNL